MSEMLLANKRIRKNFGKIQKVADIPDLIGMQRESYNRFLQMDKSAEDRENVGLQAVFKSVFPINDFTGSASLEYPNALKRRVIGNFLRRSILI